MASGEMAGEGESESRLTLSLEPDAGLDLMTIRS